MNLQHLYIVGLAVLLAVSALAQPEPVITMSTVMTAEQLQATGVGSLTPIQRAALDRWLSAYTVKLIGLAQQAENPPARSPAPAPASTTYSGSGGGHWIKSTANNGAIIVLEDGSIWDIESVDRIDTALWLPITDVTVVKASSPIGDYKYVLINTEDGEKAQAKFLGKQ